MRPRRRRRRAGPRIAVLLVLLACLGGGLWLAFGRGGDGHETAPTGSRLHLTLTAAAVAVGAAPSSPPRVRRLTLPATPRTGRVALPILMYHRIDVLSPSLPALTRRLTVAPADFAAQMRWLHGHGYHAVTQLQAYDAIVRGEPLPRRPILITFDDGYRDVLRYALPLLHHMRMPATAYVITGRISGNDTSFFTWGQLRRLERNGMEVGSHTVTHPDLTTLSSGAALGEMLDARRALERHLGHPVQWFAYPAGAENPSVVALARRAGYVLAVTTQPGAEQDAARPLELHRYEVLDSTGVAGLASMLGAS